MRIQVILHPILLTLLAVGNPAEAGFIGAAVRGIRAGVSAARFAPAVNVLVSNAFRNVRRMLIPGTGQLATRIRDRAKTVRTAMTLSEEGKKTLKFGFVTSTISGTVSGTISGNIGRSGKRGIATDRAEMMSRELYGRQATNEILEPGGAPEGVTQDEWDLCFWDTVTAAKVHISGENDWIQMEGMPKVCSIINDKIAKDPEAGAGKSCGDGCIRYEGLDKETFDIMADYLNGLANGPL